VSDWTEVETTVDVYLAIKNQHAPKGGMIPFASFTDTEGTFPSGFHGHGRIETWWALDAADDFPIIAHKLSYDVTPNDRSERTNETHRYFLCVAKSRDD